MESILAALIVIMLILFTALTGAYNFMSSQDTLQGTWQEMQDRVNERARTDLTPIDTQIQSSGAVVELTLRNDGDARLADFDQWDLIFQYYEELGGHYVYWLSYNAGEPVTNEWTVAGIYQDATSSDPEVFEPGILNSGEEIVLRARVSPSVGTGTTNLAALSTANGVNASTIFTR